MCVTRLFEFNTKPIRPTDRACSSHRVCVNKITYKYTKNRHHDGIKYIIAMCSSCMYCADRIQQQPVFWDVKG